MENRDHREYSWGGNTWKPLLRDPVAHTSQGACAKCLPVTSKGSRALVPDTEGAPLKPDRRPKESVCNRSSGH